MLVSVSCTHLQSTETKTETKTKTSSQTNFCEIYYCWIGLNSTLAFTVRDTQSLLIAAPAPLCLIICYKEFHGNYLDYIIIIVLYLRHSGKSICNCTSFNRIHVCSRLFLENARKWLIWCLPISLPNRERRMAPAEVTTAQVLKLLLFSFLYSCSRGRDGTRRAQPSEEKGCSNPSTVLSRAWFFNSQSSSLALWAGLRFPL